MSKNIIHSPVEGTPSPSCDPSGHVVTDGKVGPGLPERTHSPHAEREVFYDQNASLPARHGGK